MQALILAAGWATRLGDLTRETPKHLLPIGDRCSLDIVVERIEATGAVDRIHVVTHAAFFAKFMAWSARRPRAVPVSVHSDGTTSEADKLGSIGDIKHVLDRVQFDDDLLVAAGDNVFDFDLTPLAARGRQEPAIALYDVGSPELASRYGVVELDAAGYVRSFAEKPAQPASTLIAVALYGLPRTMLGDVDAYLAGGGSPDALGSFMEWLHARRRVAGLICRGRWFDIGSPDEYARVQREFGA